MAQNWFKHDYNAKSDEKVLELRAEYGWAGYGLFFAMIETMCEQETGSIDTDRIGGLSIAYGKPKEELLTFINYCIEIELFYEDEDGLVKNKRVIEHLEKMNTYKEAGKKGAKKRWNKESNRGGNSKANNTPNADKIRLDKNTNVDFETFWDAYDKKVGSKKKAKKYWYDLSDSERERIMKYIKNYKDSFKDSQFQPYATTFLNQKYFEAEEYAKNKNSVNINMDRFI